MPDYLDPVFWSFYVTVGTIAATWLLRKRVLHWFLRQGARFALDAFLDEEVVKHPNGTETRVLAPNSVSGAFLKRLVPGLLAWVGKNVKITLPSFSLPEGMDLKAVGMSAMAQKVMSGKKLKVEDAMPMILGYVKEWADKSGILETLGKVGSKAKPKADVVNPFLKEIGQ
jgi:hypothetical protein